MTSNLMADVASWNNPVWINEYAGAGHVAIAIKATEGLGYENPYHRGWTLQSQQHHLSVFHYHFARPDAGDQPAGEAMFFLDRVRPLLGARDYVVLDLERATPAGWSHDPAWCRTFDETIRSHSRFRTIVYASRSTLQLSADWLTSDKRRVWDADWSTDRDYAPPGYSCALRQFTDGVNGPEPHSLPGIGRCDVSRISHQLMQSILKHR